MPLQCTLAKPAQNEQGAWFSAASSTCRPQGDALGLLTIRRRLWTSLRGITTPTPVLRGCDALALCAGCQRAPLLGVSSFQLLGMVGSIARSAAFRSGAGTCQSTGSV